MRPPKGMTFTKITTPDDLARGEVRWRVEVCSTVHLAPPIGAALTGCCFRTPFELPRWDRLTLAPDAVTCAGNPADQLTALWDDPDYFGGEAKR